MIGLWSAHASLFLWVAGLATLAFALPMLISPLGWAKPFRWAMPERTELAIYFGRCLGGVVCVLAIFGLVAAGRPEVRPFYFELMIAVLGINIAVHAYGAARRIQPRAETIEIAVWAGLLVLALLFYPRT